MANRKLTDLPILTTPDITDVVYVVDVSDTTESAEGTSKKATVFDIVNAALPNDYALVIYVNNNNPNAATIFDDVNPPTTNNDAFKADADNVYIALDSSVWVYNGSVYVTKALKATSNFYISGTSADAGANKASPISRTGSIKSSAFIKDGGTSAQFLMADGSTSAGGGGGGATNLSYTPSPTDGTVTSDTGTDATIPLADGTNAGLLKPAKYTVLENTSGTNSGNETSTSIATINHAASAKTTLVDADEVTGQNSATSFSLIRTVWSDVWTYIKSKADTFYQPKGVRITNATTTGSYAVDWNAADVWQLTLTGATTITDSNLPTGTATKVIELVVKGAFAITLPAYYEATPSSGTYDGSKWNHFVVSCIIGTAASEKVIYSNEVLAT